MNINIQRSTIWYNTKESIWEKIFSGCRPVCFSHNHRHSVQCEDTESFIDIEHIFRSQLDGIFRSNWFACSRALSTTRILLWTSTATVIVLVSSLYISQFIWSIWNWCSLLFASFSLLFFFLFLIAHIDALCVVVWCIHTIHTERAQEYNFAMYWSTTAENKEAYK